MRHDYLPKNSSLEIPSTAEPNSCGARTVCRKIFGYHVMPHGMWSSVE